MEYDELNDKQILTVACMCAVQTENKANKKVHSQIQTKQQRDAREKFPGTTHLSE